MPETRDASFFQSFGQAHLPGLLGMRFSDSGKLALRAELELRQALMAPNGYLHAGTIVSLADTACGYGCYANLPEGASGFTTLELKSNFMGTARSGLIACEARALHTGRSTQVWDATVTHQGKTIASFRCTELILWPTPQT